MSDTSTFQPTWISPPGDTIRDLLLARRLSTTRFAAELNLAQASIEELLNGQARITRRIAALLSQVLGFTENFWLNRDHQYLEDVERQGTEAKAWARSLPLADMRKFRWIEFSAGIDLKVRAALDFFAVADVDEWRSTWTAERIGMAAFRTSPTYEARSVAVAAWLRQGEIAAQAIGCGNWSAAAFQAALPDIRSLSRNRDPAQFLPALQRACATCGVAVVVARTPAGCPASGATRFTPSGQAILQLSFRYLSDDQFWFTFFHEAGHLILHEKRLFLETPGAMAEDAAEDAAEDEADQFAETMLVPPERLHDLKALGADAKRIMRFARDLGISPGIVVGQLQHRGLLARNRLNFLKRRFAWQ